jgi:hypothetical protein
VGSFPFTTISPNIGRGLLLVPDPCMAAGLEPGHCRPLYGFAPGFSPAAAVPEYSNCGPLAAWARGTGWGSNVTWRKVRGWLRLADRGPLALCPSSSGFLLMPAHGSPWQCTLCQYVCFPACWTLPAPPNNHAEQPSP